MPETLRPRPTLDDAILLAVQAHRGQRDKGGQPYVLHPLRLMMRLDRDVERIVAVLHDVVEDSRYSLADLRQRGYAEDVLQALDCLTRRTAETYGEFIDRVKTNAIARRVKLADLEDNMDVRRLTKFTDDDRARLVRYHEAWAALRGLA
jgi:(p)ppGpp synthase/HD superfamily hydrolase